LDEPSGDLGAGAARGAAIVCHPHPLHGGTMRSTMVFRIARALRSAGIATLRFNFRGVGASEGEHDGNGGEEGDASAALDLLAERFPARALWAAGYSFGAHTVAALAVRQERIRRIVLVALPVAYYDSSALEALAQPGLLVFGSEDRFGTQRELRARHPDLPKRLEVLEIPAADHFFRKRTPLVEEALARYASKHALGSLEGPAGIPDPPRAF